MPVTLVHGILKYVTSMSVIAFLAGSLPVVRAWLLRLQKRLYLSPVVWPAFRTLKKRNVPAFRPSLRMAVECQGGGSHHTRSLFVKKFSIEYE